MAVHSGAKSAEDLQVAEGQPELKASNVDPGYNFGWLDEQSKRMIRRAILKAVAIPGYQVPFAGREMPLPYGWGTGGIQVTAAVIGADDVLKVIDQGADDTTNAVSIRRFFARTSGVETTTLTAAASMIQTRHRIPETPLKTGQIIIYQVPIPEPLRFIEPSESETRKMHGLQEYGVMHVKLYEDIARFGYISTAYAYPVMVNGRYLMDPSPIPKFDNPKLHQSPALQLFGAGREKRIYAVPPYTDVISLDFEDYPFTTQTWGQRCHLCASADSFLDEVITDDSGSRIYVCSDTDYCQSRLQGKASVNNNTEHHSVEEIYHDTVKHTANDAIEHTSKDSSKENSKGTVAGNMEANDNSISGSASDHSSTIKGAG